MAQMKRSPLAPRRFPALPTVAGVATAVAAANIRKAGRKDLLVAKLAPGTTVAGVLTSSLCPSAPVDWCRKALKGGTARLLVVNSGNANAFTGRRGRQAVVTTLDAATEAVGCARKQVLLASTGVIGEPLPAERIADALPAALRRARSGQWRAAAQAIMTTDTFPKGAGVVTEIDGHPVTIVGIAKGSGMIAPNMATMLGFVFTDAKLPTSVLRKLIARSADRSFNAVTVDSDTSTSDTLLLFATGQAQHPEITKAGDKRLKAFRKALDQVCGDLAVQLARDGEGAEKLITVTVNGAADNGAARRIGLAIANSPLVKTAVAGEDANWGRIVMAVGKAGERAKRDRLTIAIGGMTVAKHGERVADYDETPVAAHMKGREIDITVDVGVGKGKATVWSCDLTHRYIDINADYRT